MSTNKNFKHINDCKTIFIHIPEHLRLGGTEAAKEILTKLIAAFPSTPIRTYKRYLAGGQWNAQLLQTAVAENDGVLIVVDDSRLIDQDAVAIVNEAFRQNETTPKGIARFILSEGRPGGYYGYDRDETGQPIIRDKKKERKIAA